MSEVLTQESILAEASKVEPSAPATAEQNPQTSDAETKPTEVDSGGETKDDPEAVEADKALKRGKNYYARKIDTLTREREDALRRADQAMELAKAGLTRQAPPMQQQTDQAPKRENFADYESWIRADAVYAARQAAKEENAQATKVFTEQQRQSEIQRQTQKIQQEFHSKLAADSKDIPDFKDVMDDAADISVGHAGVAIVTSDSPAKIMHYLAKNPEIAASLALLDPIAAAREVGKIEAALKTPAQVSSAPKPGKPVGSKGGGGEPDPDKMDMDEYVAWRRKNRQA